MTNLDWAELAEKAVDFEIAAQKFGFCTDLLPEILRRLYALSPHPMHHEDEERKDVS